jgi:hypothetical protein
MALTNTTHCAFPGVLGVTYVRNEGSLMPFITASLVHVEMTLWSFPIGLNFLHFSMSFRDCFNWPRTYDTINTLTLTTLTSPLNILICSFKDDFSAGGIIICYGHTWRQRKKFSKQIEREDLNYNSSFLYCIFQEKSTGSYTDSSHNVPKSMQMKVKIAILNN